MATAADRLAALTSRERAFLAAGVIAVVLFALYFAWPQGEADRVELGAAPPAATPPPVLAPPPVTPPPASAPAAVDAAAIGSLVLHGVFGGGPGGGAAVFGFQGGGQRMVRVGRPVTPGVTLTSVAADHAILTGPGGAIKLAFNKPAEAVARAPAAGAAPAVASSEAAQKLEVRDLQLGLDPAGKSGGYTIRRDARLPQLARVGLQPGDTIMAVNGSILDEERLMELPWQMANSDRVDFDYVRGGKPMKATLVRRPQGR